MLVEQFEGANNLAVFLATILETDVVAITQAGSWYTVIYTVAVP